MASVLSCLFPTHSKRTLRIYWFLHHTAKQRIDPQMIMIVVVVVTCSYDYNRCSCSFGKYLGVRDAAFEPERKNRVREVLLE